MGAKATSFRLSDTWIFDYELRLGTAMRQLNFGLCVKSVTFMVWCIQLWGPMYFCLCTHKLQKIGSLVLNTHLCDVCNSLFGKRGFAVHVLNHFDVA
uniref:C2H2-type domain-containing protein n=1 Tax=Pyxicephalus adspersus TaxID=30357 RepID=A0AAV3B5Y8_PYXAD|nr:TPA: hypothetical protein GDO54_001335 [Pyxicephalus adspersus]